MGAEPHAVTFRARRPRTADPRPVVGGVPSRAALAALSSRCAALLLPVAIVALLAVAAPATAQVPVDSTGTPTPTGTGGAPPVPGQDPTQVVPDSLAQEGQDSLPADTIFYNLPALENRVPSGFATGVWEWDREAILTSTANTLAELLSELPQRERVRLLEPQPEVSA